MSSQLKHFGISGLGRYQSSLAEMYLSELCETVKSNGFAALVGQAGAGKTTLIRQAEALLGDKVTFVHVTDFKEKNVRIGSILENIVLSLTHEPVRRSSAARSHQVVRLLGEAHVGEGRRICLVIDDAHRLHPNTLSALKILRERAFGGVSPLLSVVLSGWAELGGKIQRRKDILWRIQMLRLSEKEGWMTEKERTRYLAQVFGEAITQEGRRWIASKCAVPEEMNAFVFARMREARLAGLDVIDAPEKPRKEGKIAVVGAPTSEVGARITERMNPTRKAANAAI